MEKIAILTLYGYHNFGNRYQNYAVQQIVKKYGYDAETIVVYPNNKYVLRTVISYIKALLGDVDNKRFIKIYRFSKKHIPIRVFIKPELTLTEEIKNDYSFFVVGSDQVWNPLIRKKERQNFFLSFANQNQRICVSPSFGVSELEEEYIEVYTQGLKGFNYLCSREQAGVDIIKSLTGKDAQLLIDPTLALTKEEWQSVFSRNSVTDSDYLLLAALSELSEEKKKEVFNIAKLNNLKIINVFDNKKAYGPDEVLRLISEAKLVYTDSFHFSAFSINFNVPFIVLKREDHFINSAMFTRMTSLLDMFGLESRMCENIESGKELLCDFSYANEILQRERERFYNFMDRSLKKDNES